MLGDCVSTISNPKPTHNLQPTTYNAQPSTHNLQIHPLFEVCNFEPLCLETVSPLFPYQNPPSTCNLFRFEYWDVRYEKMLRPSPINIPIAIGTINQSIKKKGLVFLKTNPFPKKLGFIRLNIINTIATYWLLSYASSALMPYLLFGVHVRVSSWIFRQFLLANEPRCFLNRRTG